MSDNITFYADKIKVSGPKVDGGFVISFEVGQDMQPVVAALLLIQQQQIVEVCVKSTK